MISYRLKKRIKQIAMDLCADYPNIETQDEYGDLWAIEQGFLGTNEACKELHEYIGELTNNLTEAAELLEKQPSYIGSKPDKYRDIATKYYS